jgi:hypothetical protein
MKLLQYFKWPEDLLLIISLISLFGAIVYWFYNLTWLGQIIAWLLVVITYFIIYRKRRQSKEKKRLGGQINWVSWPLLASTIGLLFYLHQQQSAAALQSPWTEISWLFWLAYYLVAVIGLWLIKSGRRISLITLIAWWLVAYGIVSLVYFSAFGFDPFVHQATEKTIIAQGQIEPKTPYYLGQYALIISLKRLTNLSVGLLERFLLPGLIALFIPWLIMAWLKSHDLGRRIGSLLIWLWPLFSWPIFIVTTPQNCAYFFLIITVLNATMSKVNQPLLWSSALASLVCQPLAGWLALTAAALASLGNSSGIKIKIARWLAGGLTAIVLPLSLWYANWQQTNSWQLVWPPFNDLIVWSKTFFNFQHLWPNQETWLLNLIYSYQAWQPILLTLLIISGWLFWRRQPIVWSKIIKPLNQALALGTILTSLVSFNFVISYERYNYLQRFLWLALIINLPAILLAAGQLIKKWLASNDKWLGWPVMIVLAGILTSGLYLTYPRVDNYSNAKGLSVSAADLMAVRWIENNAADDYIVLANQQVGAAALGEYGFYPGRHRRYLQNDLFYYPIPTSGKLYGYYLEMVDDYPQRSTIKKAAKLAGVNQAYLVLNSYWYGFEKLAQEAAVEADSMFRLENDQIIIFFYDFSANK